MTVSWTGLNASGGPLLGDWTDAVYLSTDDRRDIRDVRVATVPHTHGLASNEVYAAQASFYVPGLLPGNYHLLIRADIFDQEREATNQPVNVAAYGPLPLGVPVLPANGPFLSGVLTTNSRAHFYAITLAPGERLLLRLQGTSGVNALYASVGAMPTSQTNDFAATAVSASQQIALTGSPGGGTVYVLVYGNVVGAAGNAYQLAAGTAALFITGITPPVVGNAESAFATMSGAGFDGATQVAFLGGGGGGKVPLGGDRVTACEYDALDEHLLTVTRPGNRTNGYAYATGLGPSREHALLSSTYADMTSDNVAYDSLGRLIQSSEGCCGGLQSMSFTYAAGGWVAATDGSGRTTMTGYGAHEEVLKSLDSQARALQLKYDDNSQLASMTLPGGEQFQFSAVP